MFNLLKEYFSFLIYKKKYWMIPLFLVLFIAASLLVLANGSPVAPFIYALF